MIMRKHHFGEYVVHGIFMLVLLAMLLPRVFFAGEILLPGTYLYESNPWADVASSEIEGPANTTAAEVLFQFVAWTYVHQLALANGEWPLWNPFECTGMPLHANYQSLAFYPLRVLHLFFDQHFATTIWFVFKLWLIGMTSYACGRGIGMGVWPSRFLAIGWMLSGYCMTWTYHPETDVACWLPVAFLGVEWLVQGRYRRGFFSLMLGATMLLFAGHPETALVMGCGLGVYFVGRLVIAREGRRSFRIPIALAGGAWAVALAVNAINILPFAEYMLNSYTLNARAIGEARSEYLRPFAIVAYWVPRFTGFTADANYWVAQNRMDNSHFVSLVYPGMIVWIAIFTTLARGARSLVFRSRVWSIAIPAGVGVLLGYKIPILEPIHGLPVISSMWGIHHIAFSMFAFAVLGALSLDRWFSKPRGFKDLIPIAWPILIVAIVVLVSLALFWPLITSQEALGDNEQSKYSGLRAYVARQVAVAATFGSLGVAVLLWSVKSPRSRVAMPSLVFLSAIDLLVAAHRMHPTAPRALMYPETALTNYLAALPQPVRCAVFSEKPQATLLVPYGISILWGNDGIYPYRFMETVALAANPSIWSRVEPLFGTQYGLYPEQYFSGNEMPNHLEMLGTFNKIAVTRDKRAESHVVLVPELREVDSFDDVLAAMSEPEFDPSRVAITESNSNGVISMGDASSAGSATIRSYTTTRVSIDANAQEDCVLVLKDAYYPGWNAYVGGTRVEVFPVNGNFRGVLLGAGLHAVEFRYEPMSFFIGIILSSLALLLMGLFSIRFIGLSSRIAKPAETLSGVML